MVLLKLATRLLVLFRNRGEAVACSSSSANCRSAEVCVLKMHSPYKLLHDQPSFQFQTTVHIRSRETPNEHEQTRLSAML